MMQKVHIRIIATRLAFVIAMAAAGLSALAHNGLTVAHSPPDAATPPTKSQPCPTQFPHQLFLLEDALIGGPISETSGKPMEPGTIANLAHIALNGLLGRPEFGGFVYSGDIPGFHFVDAANQCHALTTAFTNGQPFSISLERSWWPAGRNMAMADSFGTALLRTDGEAYAFGNQNGAHFHPIWLARRPGVFPAEFRVISNQFDPSSAFSLRFGGGGVCAAPGMVDLAPHFNADVVDSAGPDQPVSFDAAGHYWFVEDAYVAGSGIPVNGQLDVFQLGGEDGAALQGSLSNCLFDDGTLTLQATVDLVAQSLNGQYESAEILIGGSGAFTSSDQIVVRLIYATGTTQVVTIRRAPSNPVYFPLLDWYVPMQAAPTLSVGPLGDSSTGFDRSDGAGVDTSIEPNSVYLQRVTFPTDPARTLVSVAFDNYTGTRRVGVFALTLIAGVVPKGDGTGDAIVDGADVPQADACGGGPGVARWHLDCGQYDFDCDSDVDLEDFASFQNEFGD